MDEIIQQKWKELYSDDRDVQNRAFSYFLDATAIPVDWAYEVWDVLVATLCHKDNHLRAIAAQILSNLAKSDPDKRMLKDLDALLTVTKDERFVTARHTLQALWKVGAAGTEQQRLVVDGLEGRFKECIAEKNCTLIRYDIIQDLKNLYDQVGDDAIKAKALELIATEDDLKYRKKYATIWRQTKGG